MVKSAEWDQIHFLQLAWQESRVNVRESHRGFEDVDCFQILISSADIRPLVYVHVVFW